MRAGGSGWVRRTPFRRMIPCASSHTLVERMSTTLSSAQIRFLRGQAHDLKAMLQVGGKGITETLVVEVDNALEHHELIKVKVSAEDRDARDAMIDDLVARTESALVQRIGHTAVLYRPSKDKR